MTQARPVPLSATHAAPRVGYARAPADTLLGRRGTLALFQFGDVATAAGGDPRRLHIALPAVDADPLPLEHWHVDADVGHGRDGDVNWARGGGWLFASVQAAEAEHDHDMARCAEYAYHTLCAFLSAQAEGRHVQRLWNYLDRINEGDGDGERYKHFCSGRIRGMGRAFDTGFPAATAIGLPVPTGCLTLYCLASEQPGQRIENPRQMSAWRYPRRYGRTPPSFARAMRLPARDALAISGTAAITGHQSRHADDLTAQLTEIRANLEALLDSAGMPAGLDADAPLKIYLRHRTDAEAVHAFFAQHLPQVPRLLLQGDICRRELLVELDGWRYA